MLCREHIFPVRANPSSEIEQFTPSQLLDLSLVLITLIITIIMIIIIIIIIS